MIRCSKCNGVPNKHDVIGWKCNSCGKAFQVTKEQLHSLLLKKETNPGESFFKCKFCDATLDDGKESIAWKCSCGKITMGKLADFKEDAEIKEEIKEVKQEKEEVMPNTPQSHLIKCPECGKEISSKAKKCVHCGKVFVEEKVLSKICDDCGKEVAVDATECPFCGCPLGYVNDIPKKSSFNKKIIMVGVIGILTVVTILCGMYAINNFDPIKKYTNLVKQGKVEEATNVYGNKIKNNVELSKELTAIQNSEMDKIYTDFVDKQVNYEDAVLLIDDYLNYESSESYAEEIKGKIQTLNTSRKAFSDAEKAEKEGNFEQAIKKYKAVNKEDPLHNEAKSKINSLTKAWKENIVNEAENYCKNKQYKEAIKNIDKAISTFGSSDDLLELKEKYLILKSEQYAKIQVTDKTTTEQDYSKWRFSNYVNFVFDVTNNSDKTIKGIEGKLTISDLFGKEILTIGCDFTGIAIAPGETYTESGLSFDCNEFIDSHMKVFNTAYSDLQFVYDITNIVYDDGTTVTPD